MTDTPRGIVLDMPDHEYHRTRGASSSLVWSMAHLPAATVRWRMDNPKPQTAAMALGTLTHVCILEPARFDRQYLAADKPDQRTKVGKADWAATQAHAESEGRIVVPTQDYERSMRMRDAVYRHPLAI